jgi:hypothetical protein
LKDAKAKAKAAIGLGKAAWYPALLETGVNPSQAAPVGYSIPAKAIAAKPSNGRTYKNSSTRKQVSLDSCVFTCENTYPFGGKLGYEAVLQRAINSRASAMRTEVKSGVWKNLADLKNRYPGMEIAA